MIRGIEMQVEEFEINGRKIGEQYPVYVIAEGCDNHMGI